MTPHGGWPSDLERQFSTVSRESWHRLGIYVALLKQWQAKINLIAPSTVGDIWHRHIADGLQLLALMSSGVRVIADLGSGAGLPGLVLACAAPVTAHLYEANGKKCAFLREAIRQTGVDAQVHHVRLETLAQQSGLPEVDVVTARALAPLDLLLAHAEPFFRQGAVGLFLKGQDVDSELSLAAKSWRIRYDRHSSMTDSQGVILSISEVHRVAS